eukprot:7382141-Pyramimonas_sp.AAC.2
MFEKLEEERQLNSGTAFVDFRVHAGARIDQTLAQFEIARCEAEAAGFNIPNCRILPVIVSQSFWIGDIACTTTPPTTHAGRPTIIRCTI